MSSALPGPVLPVLFAVAGGVAGAAARRLLARLRRGVRVPRPWCELGVAVAWGTTGALAGAGAPRLLPVLLGLGWLAVAASAVDVAHRRLPDALTVPALPVTVLLLAPLGVAAVLRGLAAAVVAVVAYGAVHLVAPAALGAGDVKLAAPLGAVLGAASWEAVALGALLAALLSGVAAAGVLLRGGGRAGAPRLPGLRPSTPRPAARRPDAVRPAALPHGPSMLLACWLVALAAAGGARGP